MESPAGPDQGQQAGRGHLQQPTHLSHGFVQELGAKFLLWPLASQLTCTGLSTSKQWQKARKVSKEGNQASRSLTQPSSPCLTSTPSTRLTETLCCAKHFIPKTSVPSWLCQCPGPVPTLLWQWQ